MLCAGLLYLGCTDPGDVSSDTEGDTTLSDVSADLSGDASGCHSCPEEGQLSCLNDPEAVMRCEVDAQGCRRRVTHEACGEGRCDEVGGVSRCVERCPGLSPELRCIEGASKCEGDQLFACVVRADCPTWQAVEDCPRLGLICEERGLRADCVVDPCADQESACDVEGWTCLDGATAQLCERNNQGCLELREISCDWNGVGSGVCVEEGPHPCASAHGGDPCGDLESRCENPGVSRCVGSVLERCREDVFGCGVLDVADCAARGEGCFTVAGEAVCRPCDDSECEVGEGSCQNTATLRQCAGSNGCFSWQDVLCSDVLPGTACSNGACRLAQGQSADSCDDAWPMSTGLHRFNDYGFVTTYTDSADFSRGAGCAPYGVDGFHYDAIFSAVLKPGELLHAYTNAGWCNVCRLSLHETCSANAACIGETTTSYRAFEFYDPDGVLRPRSGLMHIAEEASAVYVVAENSFLDINAELHLVVNISEPTELGTLTGAAPISHAYTGSVNGADFAYYRFTTEIGGELQVDVTGSSFFYADLYEHVSEFPLSSAKGAQSVGFRVQTLPAGTYMLMVGGLPPNNPFEHEPLDSHALTLSFTELTPEAGALCLDGSDNDLDGRKDCSDPACFGEVGLCDTESGFCEDGLDSDLDSLVDCDDPDCASTSVCTLAESCARPQALTPGSTDIVFDDSTSDDYPGCEAGFGRDKVFTVEVPPGKVASLGLSGTGSRGLALAETCDDLREDTCLQGERLTTFESGLLVLKHHNTSSTKTQTIFVLVKSFSGSTQRLDVSIGDVEVCDDGSDNDGDGRVDCLDPVCFGAEGMCTSETGLCDDFGDNDLDGASNCDDSDCFDDPACVGNICTAASTLEIGDVISWNTSAYSNSYGFGCGGCGHDRVFRLVLPPRTSALLKAEGIEFAVSSGGCASIEADACTEQRSNTIIVDNAQDVPGTFHIVVDDRRCNGESGIDTTLFAELFVPLPGERCEAPLELPSDGTWLYGTVRDFQADYAFNCVGFGADVVYTASVPAGGFLDVDLDVAPSTGDLILSYAESCADIQNDACVVKSDNDRDTPDEFLRIDNRENAEEITAFVVVSANFSSDDAWRYALRAVEKLPAPERCDNTADDDFDGLIDCGDPDCIGQTPCPDVPGNFCENAIPLSLNTPTLGDTTIAADIYDGLCGDTGPERVYAITVPAGETLHASVTADFDVVLAITESCEQSLSGQCIAKTDTPGTSESITYDNTAGSQPVDIFLIVDGWNQRSGQYTLTASTL